MQVEGWMNIIPFWYFFVTVSVKETPRLENKHVSKSLLGLSLLIVHL